MYSLEFYFNQCSLSGFIKSHRQAVFKKKKIITTDTFGYVLF